MVSLEHLSYSSVNSYLMCGHSWRLRYIDKAPAPTATALVFGSAVHGAIETHLRTAQPIETAWSQSWGQQLERNQNVDWAADTPDGMEADGLRILTAPKVRKGLSEIALNFDAEHGVMEKRIELAVPGVAVPIIGYIDIITKDGIPGDFKTAARMWSDSKAEDDLQSLFYLAALNQEGFTVPGLTFRHYVISKTQTPELKVFEVQHKLSEIMWLFDVVKRAWEGIDAGIYPMVPGGWKCSPKYCEYYPICRGRYA